MNYKISPHKYFLKGRGGLPLQDNNIFFFLESESEFFVKLKGIFGFSIFTAHIYYLTLLIKHLFALNLYLNISDKSVAELLNAACLRFTQNGGAGEACSTVRRRLGGTWWLHGHEKGRRAQFKTVP